MYDEKINREQNENESEASFYVFKIPMGNKYNLLGLNLRFLKDSYK